MLHLLLPGRVTTVAEAAFQDRVWRPALTALHGAAQIRIVHCTVPAGVAFSAACGARRAIRAPGARRPGAGRRGTQRPPDHAFERVSVDAPWIEVNTTAGYRPGLSEILAFVSR